VDITIINLISILIGSIGIFGAITKFAPREQHKTFLGGNIFSLKADIVENIRTYVLASFAVIGLLIQALKVIFWYGLPERVHDSAYYTALFLLLAVIFGIVILFLLLLIDKFARKYWLSDAEILVSNVIQRGKEVLHNRGLLDKDLDRHHPDILAEIKLDRYHQIIGNSIDMCKLLDIPRNYLLTDQNDIRALHDELRDLVSLLEYKLGKH